MKKTEKFFLQEITKLALPLYHLLNDLSVGQIIGMIRKQIGISQKILSTKAKIPQSTLSRIERSTNSPNLATLEKILGALSCDLVLVPVLRVSPEAQRRLQAKQLAEKHIQYLKGTMNLEGQEPDSEFIEELRKEKEEELLRSKKLWEEKND